MKPSWDASRNQLIDANCLRKPANVGRTSQLAQFYDGALEVIK